MKDRATEQPRETLGIQQRLSRPTFDLNVDFELPADAAIGLYGASGSGKSTLLRCIAGIEPGAAGRLQVGPQCWQSEQRFLPAHERRVGYVFQDNRLFPHLSVLANVRYGARSGRHNAVDDVIELFGLRPLLKRRPHTLSGGESRRVALARALARDPDLLLLDEPLTGLDGEQREEVLPFLDRLRARFKLPMIFVSHHIDEIIRLCDYLLRIDQGSLLACGTLEEVLMRRDLPMLAGDQASSILTGQVSRFDERYGLTRVACDFQEILVAGRQGNPGELLRLRILARDVSLCLSQPRDSSIQNILPVTIEALTAAGASELDVTLSLGQQRLLARVTHRAHDKLRLAVGQKLFAQIKSVAVRQTRS